MVSTYTYTPLAGPNPPSKTIRFPDERSFGAVVIRDWGGPVEGGFRPHWKDMGFEHLAPAQGVVVIPAGKEVRLSLSEDTPNLGSGLDLLAIDDLQYVTSDNGMGTSRGPMRTAVT